MGTSIIRASRGLSRLAEYFSAVVVVSTLCLGCQGTRPLAVTGHTHTRAVEHREGTNIVAIDWGLTGSSHGDIQVARQSADWSPDGRLNITVEFENRTKKALRLQIQTAFKDAKDGFLSDQTPYRTIVLPRNQTTLYEASAMTKDAQRAHVRVRYAQPE